MAVPQTATPNGENTPDHAVQQTASENDRAQTQAGPSSAAEGIQGPAMPTLPTFTYRDWVRLQELRAQFEGGTALAADARGTQAPAPRLFSYADWGEYQRLKQLYEAGIRLLDAGSQGQAGYLAGGTAVQNGHGEVSSAAHAEGSERSRHQERENDTDVESIHRQ